MEDATLVSEQQAMRPLPILWGFEPTKEDWDNLRAAKRYSGHKELVVPRPAVPGSPGIILCIGIEAPTWAADRYAYVPDARQVDRLTEALRVVREDNRDDPRLGTQEQLLSKWMGGDVREVIEEIESRTYAATIMVE